MTGAEWVAASRPRTLGAAVVPVVVGVALAAAAGPVRAGVAVLTLVVAVLIQITTNLANDHFDAAHGADGPDRLGPPRMSGRGPEAARATRAGMIAAATLAAVLGLGLVGVGGMPILLIGAASLVAAVAYTGGPYPLAYHGWGDAFVFVFFGPVAIGGTLVLQGAPVDGRAMAASVVVGALATTMLVVNNVRDVASDARVGKRTLAVQWGVTAMRVWYGLLVGVAFAAAVVAGAPIALLALPLGILETVRLGRRSGAALNASLAGSARLHLVVGALLAVGVLA
jgi:1,4-dihydroxy-2-naphthoate octaprenyltransferase